MKDKIKCLRKLKEKKKTLIHHHITLIQIFKTPIRITKTVLGHNETRIRINIVSVHVSNTDVRFFTWGLLKHLYD